MVCFRLERGIGFEMRLSTLGCMNMVEIHVDVHGCICYILTRERLNDLRGGCENNGGCSSSNVSMISLFGYMKQIYL
jgi:hypothetical protein